MHAAAQPAHQALEGAWSVTREGVAVATVDVREDGGAVVVGAKPNEKKGTQHRFASVEAADAFLRDLLASFAYLGCDVVAT